MVAESILPQTSTALFQSPADQVVTTEYENCPGIAWQRQNLAPVIYIVRYGMFLH